MSQEFQVVLLSGGSGNRMYPLTVRNAKALLPIANRPLISYQLEFLARAGFTDVIVVLSSEEGHIAEIKHHVSEQNKGKLKVSFEILKSGKLGTAETLLKIKDKIKNDFIVMSGDLIVQEDFLHHLADIHRAKDAAVSILLHNPPPPVEETKGSKEKVDSDSTSDFIGLDEEGRILLFEAEADVDEKIVLSKSLLRKYSNITIHRKLVDAHFYIFSRWVLDLLESQTEMSSIKAELLPFLVRLQLKKRTKKGEIPERVLNSVTLADQMSSLRTAEKDRLGCFAAVVNAGYCIRVNTIKSFIQANNDVARGVTSYSPTEKPGKGNFIGETAAVDPKTQVGPECVVGEYTKIGEKCSVKKSNIGMHCNIGNNVKIINSVIMDHVTILDKSTIQNCTISNNVYVADSCNIVNCHVGSGYSFDPKTDAKNESLEKDAEDLIQ